MPSTQPTKSDTLLVNEMFSTIQGEGPSLGMRATFLRLAMCNLTCTWCDTKYTWDWQAYSKTDNIHAMRASKVVADLKAMPYTPLLVITGGEPMLQHPRLKLLCTSDDFPVYNRIEIETNGTIAPPAWMESSPIEFNVSPKLEHSGNSRPQAIRIVPLQRYADLGANFKFVCQQSSDLVEIENLAKAFDIFPEQIWIMPEGTNFGVLDGRIKNLSQEVIDRGWNLTTRLHVQLWGNERAR